jgi:hypothetical protein
MFKKFGLILSAVLGLLAFAIPSSAQSAPPAGSTSKMNVQFKESAGTTLAASAKQRAAPTLTNELEGRRRATRRRSPAPCPACGMG